MTAAVSMMILGFPPTLCADATKKRMKKLKLKGVSEYQASWLHDSDLEVGLVSC